jgi:hypothetical protein
VTKYKSDLTVNQRGAVPLDLQLVTKLCGGGHCPTVYRTNRGTVVVQGYAVPLDSAEIDLPPGELLVEIPAELLQQACEAGA